MVEASRGLEERDGPAGSTVPSGAVKSISRVVNVDFKFLLSSVHVLGVSCRVACERTTTDTRRPLGSGREAACAGFEAPCIKFQPISCRAPWRPAPPAAGQVR